VSRLTGQAKVVDFEVVVELNVARFSISKRGFHHIEGAPSSTRAAAVQNVEHVDEAADVSEVGSHTSADLHSTVDSSAHHEHFAWPVAQRLEARVVAIFAARH